MSIQRKFVQKSEPFLELIDPINTLILFSLIEKLLKEQDRDTRHSIAEELPGEVNIILNCQKGLNCG